MKSALGRPIPPRQVGSGPTGTTFPSIGRKSKPLSSSQPKLVEVKLGMALSCASAGMAIPTEAISAARHTKASPDMVCLPIAELALLASPNIGRPRLVT